MSFNVTAGPNGIAPGTSGINTEQGSTNPQAIAVVGMACHYPGAATLGALWENILACRQQFRPLPSCRLPSTYLDPDRSAPDKSYGSEAAVLDGFAFDPIARRIPRQTFEATDIVHWLALEVALRACADAGLQPSTPAEGWGDRERMGVIVGNTMTGEETRANTMRTRWPFVERVTRAAAASQSLSATEVDALVAGMQALYKSVFPAVNEDTLAGGLSNTIAGRICNYLDLGGGGYTVDGACASSLLAVATAADYLVQGRLDTVIAGGVDVSLDTFELVGFAKATALSAGEMRVYDARGDGFIPGEGCGMVVLKRLGDAVRDGDRIYAVLRGWGVSSDGRGGMTAPKIEGQHRALRRAYAMAGYGAADVDFFEGHGTGTRVGDRVELTALARAVAEGQLATDVEGRNDGAEPEPLTSHRIGVTSFKALVGHTKAAAGIGGVIKTALALHRRVLPPFPGCDVPNDVFRDDAHGLFALRRAGFRDGHARLRAGVSAMGFGGINCHVTLESGDPVERDTDTLGLSQPEQTLAASQQDSEVFPLSGDDWRALRARAAALRQQVEGIAVAELADLAAACAHEVVNAHRCRVAVVARSRNELLSRLEHLEDLLEHPVVVSGEQPGSGGVWVGMPAEPAPIGALFPGQGSQHLDMGRALVERFDWARQLAARAEALFAAEHGESLLSYMHPSATSYGGGDVQHKAALAQTARVQPALCLASMLWFRALQQLGVTCDIVGGHSLGELTALWAAGGLDDETLLRTVIARGAAMTAAPGARGGMVALACGRAEAQRILAASSAACSIANLNAPRQTVVAGDVAALEHVERVAADRGVRASRLPVSNAFHSPAVADAAARLRAHLPAGRAAKLTVPVVSGREGRVVSKIDDLRDYVAAQIVEPVDFVALLAKIAPRCTLLVEVGPGSVLSSLASSSGISVLPVATVDGYAGLHEVLAGAWVAGHAVDWAKLHEGRFVRPFVPAASRSFYVNPCERPFPGQAAPVLRATASVSRRAEVEVIPPPDAPTVDSRRLRGGEVLGRLMTLVSERTGFPVEVLHPSMRLLDDLNLDSIKASALLYEIARQAGAAERMDPQTWQNGSLGDIAAQLALGSSEARDEAKVALPQWVRGYVSRLVEAPVRGRSNAASTRCLVVHGPGEAALARAIAARFAAADSVEWPVARKVVSRETRALIIVLPGSSETALPEGAARLAALAELSANDPSLLARLESVTFVQLGDGSFGIAGRNPELAPAAAGSRSFAACLSLEQPHLAVRCIEVARELGSETVARCVAAEHTAEPGFVASAHGRDGVRREPSLQLDAPEAAAPSSCHLGPEDVVLVTGGGKGITAACALALAERTGTALAIIGRSPAPRADDTTSELAETLARLRDAGVRHGYASCDVGDAAALGAAVARLETQLGPVTGVVHGAGLNVPRAVESVSFEDAFAELGPKLLGASHLVELFSNRRLKLFVALTSIIGVTGMPRNAWYAFANENVDLLLRRYAVTHPTTHVVSYAYGAWQEVGMGAKLGSVEHLARMGIASIPVPAGVQHFLRWIEKRPPELQMIITGAMGELPVGPRRKAFPDDDRFLRQRVRFEPGVECVARTHVNVFDHAYLLDHDFKGSLLFPTVMGLEAMARAVLAVLQERHVAAKAAPNRWEIEDIALEKPIVVDRQRGETIEIRATVDERATTNEPWRVAAEIRTEQSGFDMAHFRATFIMRADAREQSSPEPSLVPVADDILISGSSLYESLLFQGPRFQHLRGLTALSTERCAFELTAADGGDDEPWVLGDPYRRDVLLQAMQLVITPEEALPVRIGRLEIWRTSSEGRSLGAGRLTGREGARIRGDVEARDERGDLLERLVDYEVQRLAVRSDWPSVAELLAVDERDAQRLQKQLDGHTSRLGLEAPQLALHHARGIHARERSQRRREEEPLFRRALAAAGLDQGSPIEWTDAGKPVTTGARLSLSHDDELYIAVAGRGPQGVDVASPQEHTPEAWAELVGRAALPLYRELTPLEGPQRAGLRLWCALEAGFKALGERPQLAIMRCSDDIVVFEARGSSEQTALPILTFAAALSRGPERMFAFVLNKPAATTPALAQASVTDLYAEVASLTNVRADGPHGQLCLHSSASMTFREAAMRSRTVCPTTYVDQMGKLRELSAHPIRERWLRDLLSGEWGLVTNAWTLTVLEEAYAGDVVEGAFFMVRRGGRENATLELGFCWEKIGGDGQKVALAHATMSTTWVAITGHGTVAVRPFPPYFDAFLREMLPQVPVPPAAETHAAHGLDAHDYGATLWRAPAAIAGPELERLRVETTQQDSNLVGNVYFANYARWQAMLLDRLFHRTMAQLREDPPVVEGELRSERLRIEHLREAMPFDTIEVCVRLVTLCERGVVFAFDFWRVTGHGGNGREKLATGESVGRWFQPDVGGHWREAPLPASVIHRLRHDGGRRP